MEPIMAVSTGKTGRGIKFEIGDGSPVSYAAIANVTSIAFTGRSAEEVDFTHLESIGGFREFRQGFKDPGSINVEFHFSPDEDSHDDLLALFLSGDVIPFRINYTGAGWAVGEYGMGYISNPGDTNINVSDPVGGTATIRVTGGTSFQAIP
jgi:predicted secreted protein